MTDSFFQQYLASYRPYKPYWNYEDGCVLLGCEDMYHASGDARYADFILEYLSCRIGQDGTIADYPASRYSLDSFNSCKLLFFAWAQTKEERYRLAIGSQIEQLRQHPRTDSGLCWHKGIYPHQVWLDGCFMAAPFFTAYADMTGDESMFSEVQHCFRYIRAHLRDGRTGLYRHGLDESREQAWADKETGCSAAFWLRGMSWLLAALTDTAVLLPEKQADMKKELSDMLNEAVTALLRYQAEDGLFYQVIDRPDAAGNYTETSGSLMAAYSMMRGAGAGLLDAPFYEIGRSILENVKSQKIWETEEGIRLTDICVSAGLGGEPYRDGSCTYYLSEPVTENDPKGVGFLMRAEAAARIYRNGARR